LWPSTAVCLRTRHQTVEKSLQIPDTATYGSTRAEPGGSSWQTPTQPTSSQRCAVLAAAASSSGVTSCITFIARDRLATASSDMSGVIRA